MGPVTKENMTFFLMGALVALAGSWPVLLARVGVPRFLSWLVGTALLWSLVAWAFPFQLIGPLGGISLHVLMGTALLVTCVRFGGQAVLAAEFGGYHRDDLDGHMAAGKIAFISVVLTVAFVGLVNFTTTSAALHDTEYRAFVAKDIEQGVWDRDFSAIDPAHLRQVSMSQAIWKGNKALSQVEGGAIGSRFKIGEYSIQKLQGELVWIAPLEYQGFSVWQSADYTPGFVMVSAEDPNREPQLVSDRKLKYLDSAYFGDNLWRHVVTSGYLAKGLEDPTFEVDDEGNPFYVYTRYDLEIGYGGADPVGALVVNPETGEMTEYSLGELPAWIDRIMPESEAYARLTWYGGYVKGWVNSWWGERDVIAPTDADLSLVWTNDGRACWFTGMTSTKSTDQALVSVALMDSRTGRVREYRVDGAADEGDVAGAVQSAVSNYKDWVPTPPIPENVYGRLAWIVPVVNTSGVPQRIAIVSADASKVALGETVGQALAEYRRKMAESGDRVVAEDASAEASVQAIVDRFATDVRGGTTTYLFTVAGDPRVYSGTSDVSPELPLTRAGDEVMVGFLDTEETVVPVERFQNLAVTTRVSDMQRRADAIASEQPLAAPQ